MTGTLHKTKFLAGSPAHTPPALAVDRALLPECLLGGDEVVLLAVKPSLAFILLRSGPWLAACAMVAALSWYLGHQLYGADAIRIGLQAAVAVALLRLSLAMFQWTSRLYVLTNRRVMRIKGVLRVDIFECPLSKIQQVHLCRSFGERILRSGTINMVTALGCARWEHLAQPHTVHAHLLDAIARSGDRRAD